MGAGIKVLKIYAEDLKEKRQGIVSMPLSQLIPN
jgi:hypothetical protein